MKVLDWWKLFDARQVCFDNEGGEGGGEGGDEGVTDPGEGGTAVKDPPQPKEKTFTQAQVDEMVVKRNKALKNQYEKVEQNYENLLKQQNLTNEQRDKLEQDLEAVRVEMMTEKEKLEREKKKAAEKYETDLNEAHSQRDYYKNLYEESTINRSISDAANAADGYNAQHFIALLGPKSQIVEELDASGEKTGKLVPKTEWEITDPDTGLQQKVLKDPSEVVDLMKEKPEDFGNLFKPNVARGVGGGQAQGAVPKSSGSIDASKLSTAEYMKMAATDEGRRALGLK